MTPNRLSLSLSLSLSLATIASLALLALPLLPTPQAKAAPLKNSSPPSLTLTTNGKTAMVISLSANGPAKTDSIDITTTTENPTGYTTNISTNSPTETCLIRPSDITNSKTCSTATKTITSATGSIDSSGTLNPSQLNPNQWGASKQTTFINSDPSQDNVWFKIPDNSRPSPISSSNAETTATGETQTITIGAKADMTLPATTTGDEYQNIILFTAIANPYTPPLAPTITDIDPDTATTVENKLITITGTDFDTAYQVFFDLNSNGNQDDDEACMNADIASSTTITCNTPTIDVDGTYDLVVKTWGGVSSDDFTFIFAPAITSVSPNAGALSGGTILTITGQHFISGTTIDIGTTACTNLNIVSETKMTCTTSAQTAGTYTVTATSTNGASNTDKTYTHALTLIAPDGTYLADITPEMCNKADIFTGTNTNVVTGAREYDIVPHTSAYVDKYYAIAKLADGRCWMISNYARAIGVGTYIYNVATEGWTTGTGLTTAYYTDPSRTTPVSTITNQVRACWNQTNGFATSAGMTRSYIGESGFTGANTIRSCGYLYNWMSATAGTGLSTTTDAIVEGSICPTNWHLPSASGVGTAPTGWASASETSTLFALALSGGTYSKFVGTSSPFRAVGAGTANPSQYLYNQGGAGTYWSSTATSTADQAYFFYYSTYGAGAAFESVATAKSRGQSVRCVVNVYEP